MELKPGFNIVTEKIESYEEMTILEFFRRICERKEIPRRITVTGLDTLLINSCGATEMVKFIFSLLKEGQNSKIVRPSTVVQFIVNGNLVKDTRISLKTKDGNIPLEGLFYGELTRQTPEWVHAVR
jgi:hypothetical protein